MTKKLPNSSQTAQISNYKNETNSNSLNVSQTQEEHPVSSNQKQANCSTSNENILLRTFLMQIEYRGELFTIRALIDPGSQRTFLTERVRNRLQLHYQNSHFEIVGIGGQWKSAKSASLCCTQKGAI